MQRCVRDGMNQGFGEFEKQKWGFEAANNFDRSQFDEEASRGLPPWGNLFRCLHQNGFYM
jgi:hypothetical protein